MKDELKTRRLYNEAFALLNRASEILEDVYQKCLTKKKKEENKAAQRLIIKKVTQAFQNLTPGMGNKRS